MTTSPSEAVAVASEAFAAVAGLHERCGCFGVRIDQVGALAGEVGVLELKTSKTLQPTFALQVAGETLAYYYATPQPIDNGLGGLHRLCLQVRDDGTYDRKRDLHEYTDPRDFDAVRDAARTAHHRLRYGGKLSEEHAHVLRRPDGVRVPGINTVLALAGYVDLRDIPAHILEAARVRGEYVHTTIELHCRGALNRATLDPLLAKYLESYERFVEVAGWTVTAVEYEAVYDCAAAA